ncbi:MAG: outer membrane beta-barrel protein [Gemmatimonadales bacterium]|nr:outer membrane beta-barrel protein [Gemmatimonadales bacterium]
MNPLLLATALALPLPADTGSADTTAARPQVTFGAFADVYYAWDAGRPRLLDRPFTTQPARHNEFNANLVFVEAKLTGERVRGRLALQAGTSVQANYAGEPSVGRISGPDLLRHVQEATVGVQVTPSIWLDGGIYFSPVGFEGWISRDNPTYTRSLVADYTPYYLSGVKATWALAPTVTAQAHLVNGWQNVSETNGDKAVLVRVDWQATPALLLAIGGFAGNEQPDSVPARLRRYQQLLARWTPAGGWELSGVFDLGVQAVPNAPAHTWHGGTVIVRKALDARWRMVVRAERFVDRGQVVVSTGTPDGFATWSGSLGADMQVNAHVLWRSEVRLFDSSDPVWPRRGAAAGARQGGFLVTSLALSL